MKYLLLVFLYCLSLNAHYLVFEDKNNSLNIEYIKNNYKQIFKKTTRTSYGVTKSNVWLHIPLVNSKNTDSYKYIRFREPGFFKIEVFDGDKVFESGSNLAIEKRQIPVIPDTFEVLLKQNSTKDIFIRLTPKYSSTYAYDIFDSKEELESMQSFFNNIFLIYISIMTLVLIMAIVLFVIFKLTLFIYYALFIISTVSFQFYQTGRILNFIQIEDFTRYVEVLTLVTILFTALFIFTLFKEFVKKTFIFNILFKALFVFIPLMILVLLITFNYYIDLFIENIVITLSFLFIGSFLVFLRIKKVKYSMFIFIGMLSFLLSASLYMTYSLGYIDNPYLLLAMQIGSIIESLMFFSLILYYIYNKILEEKEKSDNYASSIAQMQRLAKMGTWTDHINKDCIVIDNPSKEILELEKNILTLDMLSNLIHPDDVESFLNTRIESIKRKEIMSHKHRVITPNGNLKYVSTHWQFRFDKNGMINFIAGYLIDISEKVLAQKELENKEALFTHQQRLAQQGEMINMIAHQWRQPLTAITATVGNMLLKNMLGTKLDSKESLDELKLINEYALHLSSTINDFRDFFKPKKDKETTTLESLIDKSLNIVKYTLESKEIKLIKEYSCYKNITSYSNEIQQVILNVIKNAQDVLLERDIQDKKIIIKTTQQKDYGVLTISDNAGGISEDIIHQIFEPYFSTKNTQEGTGLGLYMSKIIISEHCEGEFFVQNDSHGALFTIKLKLDGINKEIG